MTKYIVILLALAIVPACATIPTTPMVECAGTQCDPPPPTPDKQLRPIAAADLQCPAGLISLQQASDTRGTINWTFSNWDARGCGRTAMYRFHDELEPWSERISPVVASPFN
jgi:hypothetical protein